MNEKEISNNWNVGDIVDVLDTRRKSEKIWCPAKIIKKDENGKLMITYIGWRDEWDEWVEDSIIIMPRGTFVHRYKSWVFLSSKIKNWPCEVYVRTPHDENSAKYLMEVEKRVMIIPYGPSKGPHGNPLKPYKHGVWYASSKISPFSKLQENRIAYGLNSVHSQTFEMALKECEESDAKNEFFSFRVDSSYEEGNAKWRISERAKETEKEKEQKENNIKTGGREKERSSKRREREREKERERGSKKKHKRSSQFYDERCHTPSQIDFRERERERVERGGKGAGERGGKRGKSLMI
mmetsp:Transcript_14538/g.14641  ORF Transcript_14538/g.14641 Transcript_14538/m.14641 type:complete len:295 (-) Transcript_14538:159-1043(-)